MFVAILQGLLITVLAFLALGLAFVVWVIWYKRVELKEVCRKAWNNDYTKDELYEKIRRAEIRSRSKMAVHWRKRLYEIYPEENPLGQHHR